MQGATQSVVQRVRHAGITAPLALGWYRTTAVAVAMLFEGRNRSAGAHTGFLATAVFFNLFCTFATTQEKGATLFLLITDRKTDDHKDSLVKTSLFDRTKMTKALLR